MYDAAMRTTLTLDAEVAERLRAEVALGRKSFKAIVNEALRRGLGFEQAPAKKRYRVSPHSSGFVPGVDAGKLNQMTDELEAEAFLQSMRK